MLKPYLLSGIQQILDGCELLPEMESTFFSVDKLTGHMLEKNMPTLLKSIKSIKICEGKLLMYRAIDHTFDDVKVKELGICWSWNIRKAYPYRSKTNEMHYYLYHALCEPEAVNWAHTIQKRLALHGHECELKLLPGAPIEVVKVEKRRKTLETLLETYDIRYDAII